MTGAVRYDVSAVRYTLPFAIFQPANFWAWSTRNNTAEYQLRPLGGLETKVFVGTVFSESECSNVAQQRKETHLAWVN